MKVKFLKSPTAYGYGYFAGDTADIPNKDAVKLTSLKVCAILEDTPDNCELPTDIPMRDALETAGIKSLDDLLKITDLTTIKGIGAKTAPQIAEYLKKYNQ